MTNVTKFIAVYEAAKGQSDNRLFIYRQDARGAAHYVNDFSVKGKRDAKQLAATFNGAELTTEFPAAFA